MDNKKSRACISLIALLLLAAVWLHAQTPRVESLTIADGLSQGMIYDIEQTDDGFMWFATKDGLNRYDGYGFEVFTNDPFNPFSIAGNDIHHMFEDSRGNLWVSIDGKGLDVLEKKSGKFLHLPLGVPAFVTETSDGVIWVGSDKHLLRLRWRSAHLDLLDSPKLDAYITVEQMPVNFAPFPLPMQVEAESDGSLLISSPINGLARYNPSIGQLTKLHPEAFSMQCRTDKGVWAISSTSEVWLIEKGGSPRRINLNVVRPPYATIRVMSDGHGNIIVSGTSLYKGSGFFRFSEDELVRNREVNQGEKVFGFDFFSPWSEVDRSGNLWVGTSGYGLRKTSLANLPFRHIFPGISVIQIISYNNQLYLPMSQGEELLVLETGALIKTKTLLPEITYLKWAMQADNGTTYLLGLGNVQNMHGVWEQQSMLGIVKDGKTRFLKVKASVSFYGFLFVDSKSRAWASGTQGQLLCYLPDVDRIVTFDLTPYLGNISQAYAMYEDAHHDIWVGTDNGAEKLEIGKLEIEKLETNSDGVIISKFPISQFQTIPSDPQSLRHNFVTAFCPDPLEPERYLWLSTKGGGLNLLDLTTNKFEHFTSRNSGLPNDVVYGILPDDAGNIWGSTNRGLFRLTASQANSQQPTANRTYRFRNFRAFDGLQSDEFNTLSFYKGKDGRLYFGGVEGLTVFDPAAIVDRKSDAQVQFTGLKINNLDVDYADAFPTQNVGKHPLDRPLHRTESLRLQHDQSTITIDFALMDFVNTKENRYRYRLHGTDDDWVTAGVNHSVSYTNLPPGSYTFEVQGSISGGEWSKSTFLKIKVLPPWWATWWAYSFYMLALGIAAYSFYKNRLRQKMEHQEALRLRELDEFKSRFFTNITHEFRTPLTVIIGNLEIMKLEIGKVVTQFPIYSRESSISQFLISKIGMTRRNAESLLRLINQILDLAKLESNSLKMNYVRGDVLPYLRYISESLHSFANAQNVMVRVESSEAEIVMDYDPERLLQIVHNLLSNAIKFTPSGGRVDLRVTIDELRLEVAASPIVNRKSSLVIQVVDTGVGIPEGDLPKVFDRFYQAKNQEHSKAGGTGIGLSLTKELVRAMGGEINVDSEVGKGTTFKVQLPLVQSPLTPKGGPASGSSSVIQKFENTAKVDGLGSPSRGAGGVMGEGNHILLIEDNPDVVEYLATCLNSPLLAEPAPIIRGEVSGARYQLDFAYNGRAGIEKALETVPDLIISDVMMPEKDGFEVCDFLKNDERSSHIPIVLLTAKADVESRIAGLKRGADAYLAKPFHREELLATVANLLELRRRLQERFAKSAVFSPQSTDHGNQSAIRNPQSEIEDLFLQKLNAQIAEHLNDSNFDGPQLARAMGLSEVQLYRKIKALTDKSTAIYIRSVRLAKGRELLQSTLMNVSEVAYAVGFEDPNYFSRTFSQEFGVAPSEVRK